MCEHWIYSEWMEVSPSVCGEAIKLCHENNGWVIAIGMTVMRSLETAARSGECQP